MFTIGRRYRGPDDSGNGGYTCGVVASFVEEREVEVTLRLPPPLEAPPRGEHDGGEVRVLDGERLVAEARAVQIELEPPEPVAFDDVPSSEPDPEHPFPH